jgi:phosphoenolpyruvate carboxylase
MKKNNGNLRKIPATMVSQHPDNARSPYWHANAFVPTGSETEECFLSFSDLGVSEYKWDWEGKLVDESVIERLYAQYYDFFKKYPLGQDRFLTFRLPNPTVETEFRLGRAFMVIASATSMAKHFGFQNQPLFEVILPMTTSAEEMISIQDAYDQMSALNHPIYKMKLRKNSPVEIIPLFEDVNIIIDSANILEKYLKLYKKSFGKKPTYLRPYIARSDPALNSGIIPTVLSIKIALSAYAEFAKKFKIPLFPILGSASLPFRGGLTPFTVKAFVNEYQGVRTALLQSAFRYDYEKADVKKAIKQLENLLPISKTRTVTKNEQKALLEIIFNGENFYKQSIEGLAETVNKIAKYLPKRRERVQHTGLFGYSRGVGSVKLPRAIGFTGALYSVGVPPEFIGSGRTLQFIHQNKYLKVFSKTYLNYKTNFITAGKYLNKKNLKSLAQTSDAWKQVAEDVQLLEKYLGVSFGPQTTEEKKHFALTNKIYDQLKNGKLSAATTTLIEKSALLRKSIG